MTNQRRFDIRSTAGWLAVFVPVAIALGNVVSETAVIAMAVLFLVHSVQREDFAWVRRPWIALALGLWTIGVVRNIFLDGTWMSFGASLAWVRFILFGAALATWILPDAIWRGRLLISCAAAVSFMALDALLQLAIGRDIIGRQMSGHRLTAEFARPMVGIEIAWLFLPVLMWLVEARKAVLAVLFGVICVAAIFFSGERYALLLTICFFLAATLNFPLLRRAAIWTVPAIAVAVLAVFIFAHDKFERQVVSTIGVLSDVSDSHYGIIWASALQMAKDRPVFGVGVRRYPVACLDPKYGPELVGPQNLPRCSTHPHNIYLEWLTETGIVGLTAFAAFVAAVLWRLGWRYRSQPADLVFFGLAVTIAMRFWPLASSTSFFIAWSAVPLWFLIGWAMALADGSVVTDAAQRPGNAAV